LEVSVSRLYGHSSASGANFQKDEPDCLANFEAKLEKRGLLTRKAMDAVRDKYTNELSVASKIVRDEPQPEGSTIFDHVFASKNLVGGEL
jgi:2-oxoisovalerate dehydrogenase E1 component alpha subunit